MEDDYVSNRSKKSSKKSIRNNSNIELLTGLSPKKLLNTAKKPVLSYKNKTSKTPLNGSGKKGFTQSANKVNKLGSSRGINENPKTNDFNKLTIHTEFENGKANSVKPPLSARNSVLANYDLIQQVDQNKLEIGEKRQNLKDLEEEIVIISGQILTYQNETNEIIEELQNRIEVRSEANLRLSEEPTFMSTYKSQSVGDKDDYTSSDVLLSMLKKGASKKFKGFLSNCTGDIQAWKAMVQKEVETFNQYLQHKHKELSQGN